MIRIIALLLFYSFGTISIFSQNDSIKTIHIYVALCDNENQGIVPVPKLIGNGQDPFNNLYWGAGYGIKTYFDKKSNNWTLIKKIKNPANNILERVIFKNTDSNTFIVADAYDGARIKKCIANFLHAASGQQKDTIELNNIKIPIGGNANLIAYIGHNGLMEFDIKDKYKIDRNKKRDIIILACYSKHYFERYMKKFNTNPLVWSTGLMSPEAYTIKWAIDGWLKNESNTEIVTRARKAYNHYQKCGIKGATNLLTTGF